MTTPEKIADLNAALISGDPLTCEQLSWHLQVDPKHAPRIARSLGLAPQGRLYPWVRVWRAIHKTEGVQLVSHLAALRAKYPGSVTLSGIEDLEAELRKPLIDFATMAGILGEKPDTLSKALRQGRATLPFPMIDMGPRTRHFRALEVRLWVAEEITLDLPEPPKWGRAPRPEAASSEADDASAAADPDLTGDDQTAHANDDAGGTPDPVKKAIFGAFGAPNRNGPT
ncbi:MULTISPECIES: hypothetical protein [unclassified Sulfitobacter]|uniref:hypothetical protein n=1 Tax=unclassified Sulfitobacter TaxID=196795 RepID=UPI0032972505|tara:strand:- start:9226 stop:9906 length:681 start_codon:yes stop_codon:yes gene_type:complete